MTEPLTPRERAIRNLECSIAKAEESFAVERRARREVPNSAQTRMKRQQELAAKLAQMSDDEFDRWLQS